MTYNGGVRAAAALLAVLASACAPQGGRVEMISRAPSPPLTRLAVAGVTGSELLQGGELARTLAAALSTRFEAVSAGDADTVMSTTELGLSGASPAALAELRRATGADGVVFGALGPSASWLELTVLDARGGDVLLRVRVKPASGGSFPTFKSAAEAGAAALAPLSRRRRNAPSMPEDEDLPPP
jgi:hypothetical protein